MAEIFDGAEFVMVRYKTDKLKVKIMQTGGHMFTASVYYLTEKKAGQIRAFKEKIEQGEILAQVPGYTIFILPDSCLDGEKISRTERQALVTRMARYYYYTWIIGKKENYIQHVDRETATE